MNTEGMKPEDVISIASALIYRSYPFDGAVLATMNLVRQDDHPSGTMATDCVKTITWTAGGLIKFKTVQNVAFVLAHECAHKWMGHGNHDHDGMRSNAKLRNIAQDFVINTDLIRAGFSPSLDKHSIADFIRRVKNHTKNPTEGADVWVLTDAARIPSTMSWREVYDILIEEAPELAGMGGGGATLDGLLMPAPEGMSAEEVTSEQVGVLIAAVNHAESAEPGRVSANAMRRYGEVTGSSRDWRKILARFMRTGLSDRRDASFRRLSRRTHTTGIPSPAMIRQPTVKVLLMVDMSGSIGQAEANAFLGEVLGITASCKPAEFRVICYDSKVCSDELLSETNKLPSLRGGGGTSCKAAFDYIAEKHYNPAFVICLTDGYDSFNFNKPKYPVLWGITTDVNIPWGVNLRVDTGE